MRQLEQMKFQNLPVGAKFSYYGLDHWTKKSSRTATPQKQYRIIPFVYIGLAETVWMEVSK